MAVASVGVDWIEFQEDICENFVMQAIMRYKVPIKNDWNLKYTADKCLCVQGQSVSDHLIFMLWFNEYLKEKIPQDMLQEILDGIT